MTQQEEDERWFREISEKIRAIDIEALSASEIESQFDEVYQEFLCGTLDMLREVGIT